MSKIIAINIGSRSKKYAYFVDGEKITDYETEETSSAESFKQFFESQNIDQNDFLIAIRIVAPNFKEHKIINDSVLEYLKKQKSIAPLHLDTIIQEIESIKTFFDSTNINQKIIGISDSTFHKSIPLMAKTYAIPQIFRKEYGIERQGYHGLSTASVLNTIQANFGVIPEKIVAVHLGGGSSVSALLDGISVDTSMGWTPLQGIPMAERVGDIDPAVIAFISKEKNISGEDLEKFLSSECGLEAISNIDKGDIRELIKKESTDTDSKLALDVYVHSVKKYIGAMSAVLGGCDMLVLTGTVLEKSHIIRSRILDNLSYLGLNYDVQKNIDIGEVSGFETLGTDNQNSILVVKTDEMAEMARIVEKEFRG